MTGDFLTATTRVDERDLDLELQLKQRERVAVLGPNGAGKSTLLAVLAGILRPDAGAAVLDGRTLFDIEQRRWTPAYTRGIALLAQDPLLFPHMSARENVAFGPLATGESAKSARSTALEWLARVDAADLADRKPAQLSGGQAQRVAIARALAARPKLLLLDEPMAALDVGAAPMLRRVLNRVLADSAALIVTHDLLEALLLTSRTIVIDGGRIVESGPTQEVIQRPRTAFTARLAGLNLLRGQVEASDRLRLPTGAEVTGVASEALSPGGQAAAVFSPTSVAVYTDVPHGSPRNSFEVTITELEPRDAQVRVRADGPDGCTLLADLTAASVSELDLYPGRRAHFVVKATSVQIHPA